MGSTASPPAPSGYTSISPDRRFWTTIHDDKINVYTVSLPNAPVFSINFRHNPYIAEYYGPEDILFIVARGVDYGKSVIAYDVKKLT